MDHPLGFFGVLSMYRVTIFKAAAIAILWSLLSATNAIAAFTDITSTAQTGGPSAFGGHGVQMADITEDGLVDFYVTMNYYQNDMPELFYRNEGGGAFAEEAEQRNIDNYDSGSHGGVWADLDNDGDFDLFNGSYEQNRIYRNSGGGMFEDITNIAGLPHREWATRGVVAFDMDNDGDLDLFAVNGYLGSGDPSNERNEVYRNDGDMMFTALNNGDLFTAPAGQGATDTDFDGDGDIDILTANRSGDVNIIENTGGGVFALLAPNDVGISHEADDGITSADINNDGRLDLLIDNHLYVQLADGTFAHHTSFSAPGYMGGFEDLDNDGDWDLVFAGDNEVFLNDGEGNFDHTMSFDTGSIDDPRSVAFGDIDNDGDMDFYYAQKRTYNRLIRNDYDGDNGWLNVRLKRENGQNGAFGTKVYLYKSGKLGDPAGRISWREARSQEGYLAQNDPVLHFGTADHNQVDLRAIFLGGAVRDQINIARNQTILISETPLVVNEPPQVTIGLKKTTFSVLEPVELDGMVVDDGLPGATDQISVLWSVVSGPGSVNFDDATAMTTYAYFSVPGTYVLRLTADDGELTANDDISLVIIDADSEPTTISVRVTSSTDDAQESADGEIDLSNESLLLCGSQGDEQIGIRFSGLELPAGVMIEHAFIQFKSAAQGTGTASLTIYGAASSHTETFSNDNSDISSRSTTISHVPWSPAAWQSHGAAGVDQQTPDLALIIQEIVNQPQWQIGNAMVFLITGSGGRSVASFDGDADGAPLLQVQYREAQPPTAPPSPRGGSGGGGGGCFILTLKRL